jgi:small subunit ribosomal protein S1
MIDTKNTIEDTIKNAMEIAPPKKGQTVEGKVIDKARLAVYVDLGIFGTGIIFGKEHYSAKEVLKKLGPGDKIKAKVIEVDNEDGYTELSLKDAQRETSWESLKRAEQEGKELVIKITGANKGGLLADLEGVKGFLPLSQLSIKHYPRVKDGDSAEILKHLQQFVGGELKVKIINVTPEENKLIFSEKAVTSKAINRLLEQYKPGDIVQGKITGLAEFGAFIKFPFQKETPEQSLQTEGLIHISELDWQLIDDVSEVIKVNDIVEAKIIDISPDGKVSLSIKALKQDPWKGVENKYKRGAIVEGKVVKFNQLGAFVEVASKIRGLVHLSEFENQEHLKTLLTEGKKYQFEIISLDAENHKMALRLLTKKVKPKKTKEK